MSAVPSRRPVRRATAAFAVLAAAAPGHGIAAAAPCPGVTRGSNGWSVLALPFDNSIDPMVLLTSGGGTFPLFAVDAQRPQTIYASEHREIWRTTNGGCTWAKTWTAPDVVSPVVLTIAQLVAPVKASGTLHALVYDRSRPRLYTSTDGGSTFAEKGSGLPAYATNGVLAVAPSDPRRVYFGAGVGVNQVVWRSDDGGATFALRTDLAAEAQYAVSHNPRSNPQVFLAVDPLVPDDVWMWGPRGVRHSVDGAATFAPVSEVRNSYIPQNDAYNSGFGARALSVQHLPGKPARVVVAPGSDDTQPEVFTIFHSDDGGRTWYEQPSPRSVRVLAHGTRPDESYGDSQIAESIRWDKRGKRWVEVPKAQKNSVFALDVAVDATARPSLFRLSYRYIERRALR